MSVYLYIRYVEKFTKTITRKKYTQRYKLQKEKL